MIDKRRALEALERILNRGGSPDEVLEDVVAVLHRLYPRVAIRVVREGTLAAGLAARNPSGTGSRWPVYLRDEKVGEIEVAPASEEDVATIVSPYFV